MKKAIVAAGLGLMMVCCAGQASEADEQPTEPVVVAESALLSGTCNPTSLQDCAGRPFYYTFADGTYCIPKMPTKPLDYCQRSGAQGCGFEGFAGGQTVSTCTSICKWNQKRGCRKYDGYNCACY